MTGLRIWVALCMAVGLVRRIGALAHGYEPDEMAQLYGREFWRIPFDAESAVNPPLLRTLQNVLVADAWVPDLGRWISVVAGTATIPVLAVLSVRVAGGRQLAGVLAAAILAVHPTAVEMSAQSRSYATYMLVLSLHALFLLRWLEAPDRPARGVVVTAALLPWLHYLAIPQLVLLAVFLQPLAGKRLLGKLYVPAAVGILPMAPMVLGETSTRVATPGTLMDSLWGIASAALQPPTPIGPFDARTGPPAFLLLSVVLAVVALAAPAARRTRLTAILGVFAVFGSVLALSPVQFVRSPVGLHLLVFLLPTLAALPTLLPHAFARALAALLLVHLTFGGIPDVVGERVRPDDAARDFAPRWHDWDAVRAGRPVALHPGYANVLMHFYLKREHVMYAPPDAAACQGHARCFLHDGVPFVPAKAPVRNALLVSFESPPTDGIGDGCTPLHAEVGLWIGDCPP